MSQHPRPYLHRYASASRESVNAQGGSYGPHLTLWRSNDDPKSDDVQNHIRRAPDAHTRPRAESSTSHSSLPWILQPEATREGAETRPSESFDSALLSRHDLTPFRPIDSDFAPPNEKSPEIRYICSSKIDSDLTTRNLCILALFFGWGVGCASLGVGISVILQGEIQVPSFLLDREALVGTVGFSWITAPQPGIYNPYIRDHRVYQVPEAAMFSISLFLTFGLTLMMDSMNFIHSTSLRWALWREGKPMFNSNLRLFSAAKKSLPNGWLANILSCLALVLAYAGIGLLTFNVYLVAVLEKKGKKTSLNFNVPGNRYAIDFNAWGLIGVGVGSLLQAIISTLSLVYRRGAIPTLSSNPLATARACASQDVEAPVAISALTSRSDMSTANSNTLTRHALIMPLDGSNQANSSSLRPFTPILQRAVSRPRTKQRPARTLIPQTRRIVAFVWINFAIFAVALVVVAILAKKYETTSSIFVEQAGGRLDFLSYLQNFGQVEVPYTDRPYDRRLDWLGLIIQSLVLAIVLGTLHLVEILTLLIRDEKIWRKATTRSGTRPDASTMLQSAEIWQCWFMLTLKTLIPWVFSYTFTCNTAWFIMLIPLGILTGLFFFLAVFAEVLIRWKPKGSQPSTFGNIPALLSLVDEWGHDTLFWGEKSAVLDGFGKAGTSGSRLADVKPNELYTRLRANIRS